jgi:uncharacterized protein (TIGR02452 family)
MGTSATYARRLDVWADTQKRSQDMAKPPESIKRVFQRDMIIPRPFKRTNVDVIDSDTIVVGKAHLEAGLNPMVLNLADQIFPGGCVSTASGPQEESLFRRTNYCMTLHNDRRRKRLYPIAANEAIYSPDVTVFRDTEAADYRILAQPFKLSFIACPGLCCPALEWDPNDVPTLSLDDTNDLLDRIRLIFQVGAKMGHNSLVLGALGCGAFKNPPADVAHAFRTVIDENRGAFLTISFPILSTTAGSPLHGRSNFEKFFDAMA